MIATGFLLGLGLALAYAAIVASALVFGFSITVLEWAFSLPSKLFKALAKPSDKRIARYEAEPGSMRIRNKPVSGYNRIS